MPLPPFRPLHPAWPMVGTIALLGAAVTSSMAGSRTLSLVSMVLAGLCLVIASRTIRRHGRSRHIRHE